jgi:hypothetical protein
MPHRAQRRLNQKPEQARAALAAYLEEVPDLAEAAFGIRKEFVAEAIRSGGLVSLTMRPRGVENCLEVYGGAIALGRPIGLKGNKIVTDWKLPKIDGFKVRFNEDRALVARLDPDFTVLELYNKWLRTSDELKPGLSFDEKCGEQTIIVTRDGLTVLTHAVGISAVGEMLSYVEKQMFNTPSDNPYNH